MVKEKINKAIKATNGKKTESLGVLMIIFQTIMLLYPDLVNQNTERAMTFVISSGIIPTLFHRFWRNNKEKVGRVWNSAKKKITGLKWLKK